MFIKYGELEHIDFAIEEQRARKGWMDFRAHYIEHKHTMLLLIVWVSFSFSFFSLFPIFPSLCACVRVFVSVRACVVYSNALSLYAHTHRQYHMDSAIFYVIV